MKKIDILSNMKTFRTAFIAFIMLFGLVSSTTFAQTTVVLTAIKDNQINITSQGDNAGIAPTLDSYNAGGIVRRALYKFDLSQIPSDAVITSATMNLYTYFIATANTPVRVYRLTADWDEGTKATGAGISNWTQRLASPATNWTTAGGDFDPTAWANITTSGTTAGTYNFNLLSLVQAWFDGTYANHGVILQNDAGYWGVSWRSREWGTAAQQPHLTITYTSASTVLSKSVTASSDDAEEAGSDATGSYYLGHIDLTSSDIELITDNDATGGYSGGTQKVGLRFTGITVPPGATITGAYLNFRAIAADDPNTNSSITNLTIKGQLIANAPTFTTTDYNISNRTLTTASASWVPTSWITNSNYNSPSIVSVIQEIVNQGTWASGNAIAIIITGTGHRCISFLQWRRS